ncbi:hypothetical protein [Novosphingobium resinovorum]|uniref:hypothetical protein n=1 Tax=Novosphingobium resinovorum TaxID=158500 RepID=UPI003D2C3617
MATAELIAETPVAAEVAELVARRAPRRRRSRTLRRSRSTPGSAAWFTPCASPAWTRKSPARREETQLGNYEGKFKKISVKTRATLYDIIDDKSVGVIDEIPERNIVKLAKPVGVIGALSPSTNPEPTPVIKAISAVKGRNSIIICPHPRAKFINAKICNLMRDALVKMGAPADLVIPIEQPRSKRPTKS